MGCTGEGGSGLKFGFKADFENSYLLQYKSYKYKAFKLGIPIDPLRDSTCTKFRGPQPSPAPGVERQSLQDFGFLGHNLDVRISLSIRARGLRFGVQVDLDPNSFSNQVLARGSQFPDDGVKFVFFFMFDLDLNSLLELSRLNLAGR